MLGSAQSESRLSQNPPTSSTIQRNHPRHKSDEARVSVNRQPSADDCQTYGVTNWWTRGGEWHGLVVVNEMLNWCLTHYEARRERERDMSHAAWSTIKASCSFVSVAADGPEWAINAVSPDNSGTGLSTQYMQQQQSMLCVFTFILCIVTVGSVVA